MSEETEPKDPSEPERLGGDLLASARGDAPSAASRARIAGAIGLGIGAAAATTATTAGAATTTAATTTTAKLTGLGLWTKVVGVAAVTVALGGAVVVAQSDPPASNAEPTIERKALAIPSRDPARERHNEIPPPESVPPVAPVPEEEILAQNMAPLASAAASAANVVSAVRNNPSNANANGGSANGGNANGDAPSPLAREIRSIDLARNALQTGYPALALKALDNHDREFPNGPMKTEADVLRVDALVANGDSASAKRLASQLLARDPAGAHAKHLKSVVGDK